MLLKNTFEFQTNKSKVTIFSAKKEFNDKEDFLQLKKSNPTYEFYTEGNLVYCWSKIKDNNNVLPSGFTSSEISSTENTYLWSKIIERGFVNLFLSKNRK